VERDRSRDGGVLIVEDDTSISRLIEKILSKAGFEVAGIVTSAEAAMASAREHRPDIALMDISIPGEADGIDAAVQLRQQYDIPTVYVTARSDEEVLQRAYESAPYGYVTKPFTSLSLCTAVEVALARHGLEEELQASHEALVAHARELDAFAHTVARDLQYPLELVSGYTDSLLTTGAEGMTRVCRGSLRAIASATVTMRGIIDELLLLAAVRKEDAPRAPLEMSSIVDRAIEQAGPVISVHSASVSVPGTWPTAIGHDAWIQQVWVNYISNAAKYGGPRPKITLGWSQPNDAWARFTCTDHGPGIPPTLVDRLFTPFDRMTKVRPTGHGLGLSIVERIVHKLGGEVGVRSTGIPGEETEFWFTLPAYAEAAHPAAGSPQAAMARAGA